MELSLNMDFGAKKEPLKLDETLVYDLLVIGSGPAGLSAALYAKRKGLNVGIISNKSGGQVLDTSSVENYLGIKTITGEALVHSFMDHVDGLKVPMLKETTVESIVKDGEKIVLNLGKNMAYTAKTLLIATGSKPRQLGVEGEEDYKGRGVAYCAICDGPLFEGRDVVVAGGGNSAIEAAVDLAKIAKSVTVIHRSQFRADQIVIDQLMALKNVKVMLETKIIKIEGDRLVSGVRVTDLKTGEESVVLAEGVFVEIGYLPNSEMVKGMLELNDRNEIIVNVHNETSVAGIYAAGDVTDIPFKQIVIAASEGAKAALSANDYINYKMK